MENLPAWIAALGTLIFGVSYLASKHLSGWQKATSETNTEVARLVGALKDRVDLLEKSDKEKDRINAEQNKTIGELKVKVATLEGQIAQRDAILLEALTHWFDKNPDKAVKLGQDAVNSIKQSITK